MLKTVRQLVLTDYFLVEISFIKTVDRDGEKLYNYIDKSQKGG